MSLAFVLLATPLFGLSLQAPLLEPVMFSAGPRAGAIDLTIVSAAQLSASGELSADSEEGGGAEADDAEADSGEDSASEGDAAPAEDDYAAQNRRRNDLIKIHRPLGIATWGAMTATVALGFIQYYNLYGFFAGEGDNPCVTGDAVFGQSQCSGTPWPHAVAAGLTTGLYATTFTISLMMPDPDDLSSGKGEFASTLRMHKFLRWVHFGGMIAQAVLGIIIANNVVGDRANDYGTLQALATVHLGIGVVTLGALTWAGALMTF